MHVDRDLLQQFLDGELELQDSVEVLENTVQHDDWADALADQAESRVVPAPHYLKEQMIRRSQMPDVVATEQLKAASRGMQMLLYGLRTAAAVLCALLMLHGVSQIPDSEFGRAQDPTQQVTYKLAEGTDRMAAFLNDFSNQIVNGGINNDKTKK